jgi:FkbM family methyltransferase
MSVKGLDRYKRLLKNISNWQEYAFHKGERKKRSLEFVTRPYPIKFQVPESLYQVFKEIFMEDFYEADALIKKLPDNPLVIDIGANAGFFNVLLFSKLKTARVFAYEPLPSNIRLFKKTIQQNESLKNIQLSQMAVTGSTKDSIELFTEDTEDNTVVSSVFAGFNKLNQKAITVPAQSLASIIEQNNLEKIDLLKLDCEGSEYDIIYNTDAPVLKKVNMMVIEVHEIDGNRNNLKSFNEYLQSLGYKTRSMPVQEGSYYMEALKN